MRYGIIKCECGQEFYFETKSSKIRCIHCNKEYDVSEYPILEEDEQDGADLQEDIDPE